MFHTVQLIEGSGGISPGAYPTNTPRVFHVETTWKRPIPRRFNMKYTWCVCRVGTPILVSFSEWFLVQLNYYLKRCFIKTLKYLKLMDMDSSHINLLQVSLHKLSLVDMLFYLYGSKTKNKVSLMIWYTSS